MDPRIPPPVFLPAGVPGAHLVEPDPSELRPASPSGPAAADEPVVFLGLTRRELGAGLVNFYHETVHKTLTAAVQAGSYAALHEVLKEHMDEDSAKYQAIQLAMISYGLTSTVGNKLLQFIEASLGADRPFSSTHPFLFRAFGQPAILDGLISAKKFITEGLTFSQRVGTGALTGAVTGLAMPLAVKLLGLKPAPRPVREPTMKDLAVEAMISIGSALTGAKVMFDSEPALGKLGAFAAGFGLYQTLFLGVTAAYDHDTKLVGEATARVARERPAAPAQPAPSTASDDQPPPLIPVEPDELPRTLSGSSLSSASPSAASSAASSTASSVPSTDPAQAPTDSASPDWRNHSRDSSPEEVELAQVTVHVQTPARPALPVGEDNV